MVGRDGRTRDERVELAAGVAGVHVGGDGWSNERARPDVMQRVPGRVVIMMPDDMADAVARALSKLGELADRVCMERDWMGERELAVALFDAAGRGRVPLSGPAERGGLTCPLAGRNRKRQSRTW